MHEITLQDDQHYDDGGDGRLSRWHMIRVRESWQTLGPDGEVVHSGHASREDAIFAHIHSNQAFAYHAEFMAQQGKSDEVKHTGTPLCGVRKVTRYETGAHWEVESDREVLDELTEMTDLPDCDHPQNRRQSTMRSTFCGRCGATVAADPA